VLLLTVLEHHRTGRGVEVSVTLGQC